ncbi:MAG: hypothetical protein NC301_08855 [Bacteroides sp.]|nr:hypothetical protein [Bacteroides sp.]
MAYDKAKGAARMAAAFDKIKESDKATAAVATVIAEELAHLLKDAEVEVRVKFSRKVEAVPGEISVDETMKGELK